MSLVTWIALNLWILMLPTYFPVQETRFEGVWGLFCGFFGFVFESTSIPFPKSYMVFWVFHWKTWAFQATKYSTLSFMPILIGFAVTFISTVLRQMLGGITKHDWFFLF